MKIKVVLLIFLFFCLSKETHPDTRRNVTELILSRGYPCEDYKVRTEDGYILSIQRIPHGIHNPRPSDKKKVVYLQHGLLDSAATWVINSPENSLGYMLADAGFDVWLGNSRGSIYGIEHEWLNPAQEPFWDFSWDHMAAYDLPATIDFILNKTHHSSLIYVGHSQGTEMAFAAFSSNPFFAQKVSFFAALAPVAFLGNIDLPLFKSLSHISETWLELLFGKKGFFISAAHVDALLPEICKLAPSECSESLCSFGGCVDQENINPSQIPAIFSHYPAGTSVRNMIHYSQAVRSGKFQKYDYGVIKNLQRYGQPTPPEYPIQNFSTPVMLFYGGRDKLANPSDVHKLKGIIKEHVIENDVLEDYGHSDFVWGLSAQFKVYQPIIDYLHQMDK